MSRSDEHSNNRTLVYVTGALGLARATEELIAESDSEVERIEPTTGAESSDANSKWVWIAGIGLLLVLWIIAVALYPLFNFFQYNRTGGVSPAEILEYLPSRPPMPRNEVYPLARMQAFRAREDYLLSNYLWVNRERGVVSIPIARAIQILAKQGVPPSRPGGAEYYPPQAGSMRTGSVGKVEPELP